MKLEELQAMSDDELNRLAAVKVMKWTLETRSGYIDNNWVTGGELIHINKWNPATDLSDSIQLNLQLNGKEFELYKSALTKSTKSFGVVDTQSLPNLSRLSARHFTIASIFAKSAN